MLSQRNLADLANLMVMMLGCGIGACSSGADRTMVAPTTNDEAEDTPDPVIDSLSPGGRLSPFAEQADESEGLVNVSSDLDQLLEHGELAGACERYHAGDGSRRAKLLCGKSMFFDETFGAPGVPRSLAKFLNDSFPDEVGPGFSKLGLLPDPRSVESLPFGLAPSIGDTVSFTCAACHLDQLPDGRYVVGGANHQYEYGAFMLATGVLPAIALLGNPEAHDPGAVAILAPMLTRLVTQPGLGDAFAATLLPLLAAGGMGRSFPPLAERYHASWLSGTMDALIEPLPWNDGVHTVSKIMPIWGLPSSDELDSFAMSSMFLLWTGGTETLSQFEHGFVVFAGGDVEAWSESKISPLSEYVLSLRAPANLERGEPALISAGEALFSEKGCASCHDGPRGMGRKLYDFTEIGTDRAHALWLDPEATGNTCCGLPPSISEPSEIVTHKIKAPRLSGIWTASRLLHNGSVSSLEDLFCVDAARGNISEPPFGDGGHDYTCSGLASAEKSALIAYLRAL